MSKFSVERQVSPRYFSFFPFAHALTNFRNVLSMVVNVPCSLSDVLDISSNRGIFVAGL